MFFELWDRVAGRGKIGLAKSNDLCAWDYQGVVLTEHFHLSYPYVFLWQDSYFMIPESHQAGCVLLYRALNFPTEWRYECTLLKDGFFVDASIFRWQEFWWMFVETNPAFKNDTLRLFYAEKLKGPWREHAHSPLLIDAVRARPAGRVIEWRGSPIRFGQDCKGIYGKAVRAFRVTDLTLKNYVEELLEPAPILSKGSDCWNAGGMHHIDTHYCASAQKFIAAVDGWRWAAN